MSFLASLLGPNWRTTISGIGAKVFATLALLAALPYEKDSPGSLTAQLWALVPIDWQPAVLKTCALISLVFGIWNAFAQKDKQVAGNGTATRPFQQNATGTNFAVTLAALLLPVFLLTGCAGSGPNGEWTPRDTEAMTGVIRQSTDAYERIRYPDRFTLPPQVPVGGYPPVVPQ